MTFISSSEAKNVYFMSGEVCFHFFKLDCKEFFGHKSVRRERKREKRANFYTGILAIISE